MGAVSHEAERLQALERDRGGSWRAYMLINAIGSAVSFVVLLIIAVTKFSHGAWAVIVLIPLLVLLFRAIHGHYFDIAAQLSTEGLAPSNIVAKHVSSHLRDSPRRHLRARLREVDRSRPGYCSVRRPE